MTDRHATRPPARLPSLDLLKGFESAARLLSFTKAAAELHLTQSAISRQVQELESQLDVALFHRRHRALALTDAGQLLYPVAAQMMVAMRAAIKQLRSLGGRRVLAVATPPSFASWWLIPRLGSFARHWPEVDVRIATQPRAADPERDGVDIAIRYCEPARAGADAVRLFGERAFPVCSPSLAADPKRPLQRPADLRNHVLLRLEEAEWRYPWLNWRTWLEAAGLDDLRPAGTLTFSGYDQMIAAALAGHGVALGRSPLLQRQLAAGRLIAPFDAAAVSARMFFAIVSADAAPRDEVAGFVRWLKAEAARDERAVARRRNGRTPAPG